MSVYGELDPMVEHRTQFAFKGKREHISKVNIPNIAYPSQHIDIDIDIPHGSRDHVIIPDTIKITFNLDIESTDKARVLLIMWVGHSARKRYSCLVQRILTQLTTKIFMIRNKDLYLSEKEREERLLQGIQSANALKARLGAKKANGTAITLTTQENAIKKTFDKRFAIPLDFDFFKHPVYP